MSWGRELALGTSARVVVPSDSVDLDPTARAVVVTGAGDLSVVPAGNDPSRTVDFVGLQAGYVTPFRVRRVMATGTTATVCTVD